MLKKSAQDGLRVDQPEWSEFASLEEPLRGRLTDVFFFRETQKGLITDQHVSLPDLC